MKGEQYLVKAISENGETSEPEKGSFFAASPWRRIFIAVLGPLFNLIFAVFVFALLQWTGTPERAPAAKILIIPTTDASAMLPAQKAGLLSGDLVTAIDGRPVRHFKDVQTAIARSDNKSLQFSIERAGSPTTLTVTPEWNEAEKRRLVGIYPWIDPVIENISAQSAAAIAGLKAGDRLIAIDGQPVEHTQAFFQALLRHQNSYQLTVERADQRLTCLLVPDSQDKQTVGLEFRLPQYPAIGKPPVQALTDGWTQTTLLLSQMVNGLVQLFTGKTNPSESLSGPLRITYYVGEVASKGFMAGWGEGVSAVANFLAFISLALFMMNLLPIPALDGGGILLSVVEGLRRKRLSIRFLLIYQQVGALIIILLVLWTTFNDMSFLMGPK